jgi:hypothetical protein
MSQEPLSMPMARCNLQSLIAILVTRWGKNTTTISQLLLILGASNYFVNKKLTALKKFTLLVLGLGVLGGIVNAQKTDPSAVAPRRCATEEVIQQRFQQDPAFRAQYEQKQREMANRAATGAPVTGRVSTLSGPVTIPVIVHVVLANPEQITEAQVDYFLNRLNLDFSGLNPDSTNGTAFYPVRGHSLLRFTRARRTPAGALTNGIERRVGSVNIAGTTYQAIKHTSAGGLDPWDVTKYYNLWVGVGTGGLLGIAPAIGVGSQTETTGSATGIDGVCVDFSAFSNGCFSIPAFALARTAVHEIGHNFGLFHSFSGCAVGADFGQPTPAGQTLPASLAGAAADDTPSQSAATSGCPSGAVASTCAGVPNPPGKMYQNYMDYTDDPCYSMFTKQQVGRMEYMLENYRAGYLTTDGATPPSSIPALDVSPTIVVSPGGSEFNNSTCATTAYPAPTCAGNITPKIAVSNFGTTTITSVTVSLSNNGGPTVTTTATGLNITTGSAATVTLPAIALSPGANVLTFVVSAPNGGTDLVASNDIFTTTVNISSSGPTPPVQGFETPGFPPAGWSLYNPNNDVAKWERATVGRLSSASMFFNNWDNNSLGRIDELRSSPFGVLAGDNLTVEFDLAHKWYNVGTASQDTLAILISSDCGITWSEVYKKWGATLATAGTLTTGAYTPVAADWRHETATVPGALVPSGNIQVAVRMRGKFGNNVYVDNINITRIVSRDLQLVSSTPGSVICDAAATPTATIKNVGTQTITGFKVSYSLNNAAPVTQAFTGQNLTPNSTTTVTLANVTFPATGSTSFKVYVSDPVAASGTGDGKPDNDTLTHAVVVSPRVASPLVENFSTGATAFPPAGWAIINNDNSTTWSYSAAGNGNTGSAGISSWTYNGNNNSDDLVSPIVTYTGADSLTLSFDVASASRQYPGSTSASLDTLEVLATSNCGASFTTVYKKWGQELQTILSNASANFPQATGFVPALPADWRNERVDVSSLASQPYVQFVFRATTNNGNNVYIDNVNVTARTLPLNLKQNGYVISPNPTVGNQFRIWFLRQPTTLRFVNIYDAKGALIWSKSYNGNGEQVITVDLSGKPAGVYFVNLGYEDEYRNVTERVIKQ